MPGLNCTMPGVQTFPFTSMRVATQRIVIDVERGDGLAVAIHLHVSHRAVRRWAAGEVERVHYRAGARHAITARVRHISVDEYLTESHRSDVHIKLRLRARSA